MSTQQKEKGNIIQSVDRAIDIIEFMSHGKKEYGVSEIAKELNLHKSTAFGLISTLENRGLVSQNPENSKYRLGLRLFELGKSVYEGMDLKDIAQPFLKHLVEKFNETVHLVVCDKGEVVYIDKIESLRTIRIISKVGARLPMYCTGVGKAMLAFMSEEYIKKYLEEKELKPYTANTITDAQKLKSELEIIKKRGYALDLEEIEEGLKCIAVPIIDKNGKVFAAISVSGASARINDEIINRIVPEIKNVAINIANLQ